MINLDLRAQFGRKYLDFLTRSRRHTWFELRRKWQELDLWEQIVLIHPDWLRDAGVEQSRIEELQGPRAFSRRHSSARCASSRIWGYQCDSDSRLEVDHLWPYALGGPTLPGNAVPLCRDHNALKGVDIHAYPWEETPAASSLWLAPQIAKIAYALGERS